MSGILPAPFLKEKLPAWHGGDVKVPFMLNRAVGINDFEKMQIKIKTVSTNRIIDTITADKELNIKSIGNGNYIVNFHIDIKKYTKGQFYKAQLACVSSDLSQEYKIQYNKYLEDYNLNIQKLDELISLEKITKEEYNIQLNQIQKKFYENTEDLITIKYQDIIGDFSEVGIFKYTNTPEIILFNSNNEEFHNFDAISNIIIGGYHTEDTTEKISEYRFQIYEENGTLFDDSGFLMHNVTNDDNFFDEKKQCFYTINTYTIKKELKKSINYYVIYTVKTINEVQISSRKYWMRPSFTVTLHFPGKLRIKSNEEAGYFLIESYFTETKTLNGSFKILRTDEHSNYSLWETLYLINFANKVVRKGEIFNLFKDFTIEPNIKYQYAIQSYSQNMQSNKILCQSYISPFGEEIGQKYFSINFEDMFLFDGERQLTVKFNPKITTFKNIILENKVETIGNKYPFFFKNGNVSYKEFPISGLISYLMDENEFFIKGIDYKKPLLDIDIRKDTPALQLYEISSSNTSLSFNNIAKEKDFKLKVFEWLSNGKPKLFRSPTEGNYIVRLMKVSLKPIDKLGRMLHSFSATAYESAECSYDGLIKSHILPENDIHYVIDPIHNIKNLNKDILFKMPGSFNARIINGSLGDSFELFYQNDEIINITLGYTGEYNINIDENNLLIGIKPLIIKNKAQIEYTYIETASSKKMYDSLGNEVLRFSSYSAIRQFYGNDDTNNINKYLGNNILNKITTVSESDGPNYKNLIKQIESIPVFTLQKKSIETGWIKNNKIYTDSFCNHEVPIRATVIYKDNFTSQYFYKDNDKLKSAGEKPNYNYYINNLSFVLESGRIDLSLSEQIITSIIIGNGLYVDTFYYGSIYEIKGSEV